MTDPEPIEDWDGEDWDGEEPLPEDEEPGQSGGIGQVWGNRNISITDPRGEVSIFDRVRVYVQSGATEPGTGRSPRLVPEDILTDLTARFVMPPGYGDLVRRLREPGTVVVSGEPGSGRHAAALMVLKESGTGATRFRELPDDGDLFLDPTVIETGERLLLDLSAVTDPIPRQALAEVRAYRASVAERQAYLAIVLSPELRYVAAELGTEAVLVGRPDGRAVFSKHVRALGIEVADLGAGPLSRHLAKDPMRHLAALAERVRRARSADVEGDWADWVATALEPDAQLDAVARFVRENPDGRTRALLLAAAVFEDATPEVVAAAAATLLEVVGYPGHEEHRLDLPDLAEALGKLEASIGDRRVRFRSMGFGDAVCTHFWGTFPDLRPDLRRWLDRSVRPRWLAADDRSAAVLRYADQCLLVGHPEDLCALVELWARRSPSTLDYLLDAAGPALTRGLLSERYGSWFRRRVYSWALNRSLWPSLATLLIGLCVGVIAPAQPHQALVRLRHFTRHAHPDVVAEARMALWKLALDGSFARRLLARVHDDLLGGRPRDIDYDLFTDVADRLTAAAAEPAVADLLADGWAALLSTRPHDQSVAAVSRRLDHADAAVLNVLAAATRKKPRARAVLYAVSRDWVVASAPDQRRDRLRTAALLRQACADVPAAETRAAEGVTH